MRLNCLAIVAPEWLLTHSQPEWVDRYGVRLEDSRLPSGEQERQAWAQSVGQDGASLLSALFEPEAPSWLAASASGGDFAAGVGAELSVERRQAELAFLGEHPSCGFVYQLAL